ncbi:MAG: para-aminobenzoate synthetase / 4-amino-4-deoxychorismate lyase [Solirubrobacterales bacterium]|nr:para-aminobenzoate synthetase / 4-amino-4-deoxychorismate lyase [Solirubrobacterales bacterium]
MPDPSPATPDPSRGLFETVLVADGKPVRLAAHLDRLAGSTEEVFGQGLPGGLEEAIAVAARPLALGRIRMDLLPDGNALRFEIVAEPIDPATFFPAKANGADLRTIHHPDWVGAHKWADRDWLESVEAELGETVPLILVGDEVLEAGRANVFLVRDGALATPPADGRILPGTARAATLALAADLGVPATERRLQLADLQSADDLFLTSSLRGIRPVRSLDGEPLGPTDRVVERLAPALRRRWLDERP